jgi:hypothetical protein
MGRSTLSALLLLVASNSAVAAFDVNEVALGASEQEIKAKFKEANCRELEWPSRAADRRCDDSRVKVGGIDASVTFYLKQGAIEGYDVRFDKGQFARMSKFLVERYGTPAVDKTSGLGSTVEWKNKGERARLSAEQGRRRASLLVWRGAFEDEIYKVR